MTTSASADQLHLPGVSINLPDTAEVFVNVVQEDDGARMQTISVLFPGDPQAIGNVLQNLMNKSSVSFDKMSIGEGFTYVIEGGDGQSSVRIDPDGDGGTMLTAVTFTTVGAAPRQAPASRENELALYGGLMTFLGPQGADYNPLAQAIAPTETLLENAVMRGAFSKDGTLVVAVEFEMTSEMTLMDAAQASMVMSGATRGQLLQYTNENGVSFVKVEADLPKVGRQTLFFTRSSNKGAYFLQVAATADGPKDLIDQVVTSFRLPDQDMLPINPMTTYDIFGKAVELGDRLAVTENQDVVRLIHKDPETALSFEFFVMSEASIDRTPVEMIARISDRFDATIDKTVSEAGWTAALLDSGGIKMDVHVVEVPEVGIVVAMMQNVTELPVDWAKGRFYLRQLLDGLGSDQVSPAAFDGFERAR